MPIELLGLLAASMIGVLQLLAPGEQGVVARRNFSETFPLFVLLCAGLIGMEISGEKSALGVAFYLAGRVGYVLFGWAPVRGARKFAWALSLAGLIGLAAELVVGLT